MNASLDELRGSATIRGRIACDWRIEIYRAETDATDREALNLIRNKWAAMAKPAPTRRRFAGHRRIRFRQGGELLACLL